VSNHVHVRDNVLHLVTPPARERLQHSAVSARLRHGYGLQVLYTYMGACMGGPSDGARPFRRPHSSGWLPMAAKEVIVSRGGANRNATGLIWQDLVLEIELSWTSLDPSRTTCVSACSQVVAEAAESESSAPTGWRGGLLLLASGVSTPSAPVIILESPPLARPAPDTHLLSSLGWPGQLGRRAGRRPMSRRR